MQITVFSNVQKRVNSTFRPTGGRTVSAVLKDDTSLLNPTFELETTDFGINYVYAFGYYYRVKDIVFVTNNIVDLVCDVDALATCKDAILSTQAFIKYAATAYNSLIIDSRLSQVTYQTTYETSSPEMFTDNGCISLQYISGADNDTCGGGVCADAMYPSSLGALCKELYTAGSTIWDELAKEAGSVSGCLTSAVYLPIDISEVSGGSSRNMTVGNYYTTYGVGFPITDRFWTRTRDVRIPWPTTDFRRSYCDISVNLPFTGVVKVSPADVFNDDVISVIAIVDKLTGKGMYYLCHDTEDVRPFMTVPFMCGASVAMSVYQSDMLGGIVGFTCGAIDAIKSVDVSGAIKTSLTFAQKALTFTPSIIGGNTGAINFTNRITLTLNYIPTSVEPSTLTAQKGRPYMAVNVLSGFSGYIETDGFSLMGSGYNADVTERVNAMMDAGIFIE